MGENIWAEISADIENHQSAWEKICGLKFQLRSRTISQHGRKYMGANLRSSKEPSASMGENYSGKILPQYIKSILLPPAPLLPAPKEAELPKVE